MKEFEQFKKQTYENQETAIKLLQENMELKEKAQLYEKLIEDVAGYLVIEKEDGKIITDDERKKYLELAIEKNIKYILEEIKKYE